MDFETTYFESIFNTPKHINLQNGCVGFLAMSEDWIDAQDMYEERYDQEVEHRIDLNISLFVTATGEVFDVFHFHEYPIGSWEYERKRERLA